MKKSPAERFWEKVRRTEGCWYWTGHLNRPGGYGQLWVGKEHVLVHRISWEIHNGPIPSGIKVLHRCDNPPCVNPKHLLLGTDKDVAENNLKKGRDGNRGRKLKPEDIVKIRRDTRYIQTIADEFGIHKSQVSRIRNRHSYKRIP